MQKIACLHGFKMREGHLPPQEPQYGPQESAEAFLQEYIEAFSWDGHAESKQLDTLVTTGSSTRGIVTYLFLQLI